MSYVIKILSIAIFLSLTLLLGIKHPIHQGDASQYDLLGWNLKQGNGFSYSDKAPFIPSMEREPAYPVFLSVIFFIFGHKYLPVQFTQIFIFLLTCTLVYYLSKEIFGSDIARYSLFLSAFCPTLIGYPMFLFSETLAILLILLMIFSLTTAIKNPSLLRFATAGVMFGIAILCKAIMLPFFILVAASLIFIRIGTLRNKIISLLLFILCCTVLILPWMLRNYYLFDNLAISLRGSKAFWVSAQKVDYVKEEVNKKTVFIISESLGDIVYPDKSRKRTSDVYLADVIKADQHEIELEKKGYNPIQRDGIFFKEAVNKIKMHPLRYFLGIPLEFLKMLSFIHLPSLNQVYVLDALKQGNTTLRIIVLVFKGIMRLWAYIIFVLAIMGMYLKRKDWNKWYFLFLIIVYINVVYSLLFGEGRYAGVLIPFYLIFASVPLANMITSLKSHSLIKLKRII